MAQVPSIDVLLNLVPERPQVVQDKLRAHPELAHKQDHHGYSLIHAAASYGHTSLLRSLINEFKVDPNIKDEDGETALFSVEDAEMAKELLALGTDPALPNNDGQIAAAKLADDDEQPAVAAYLREASGAVAGDVGNTGTGSGEDGENGALRPPPLPEGLQLNIGTMPPEEDVADPEFKRRIDELAARGDFETEEAQQELRAIIADALTGTTTDPHAPPASRRRVH